jgi:hypothetical protein
MQASHQALTHASTQVLDVKKLSRFYSEDKPPRKRLANALEFLKTVSSEQQELFWAETSNVNNFFSVLHSYLSELETMYVVDEKAKMMAKLRSKKFQAEDWTEIFEGLEVLIKSNKSLLVTGWQYSRFLQNFQKLLLCENLPFLKKYAFRYVTRDNALTAAFHL